MKNINKAEALHMLLQIERSEEFLNARCELIDLTPDENKDMEDLLDVEELYSQGHMMLRKFLTSKILGEMT